MSVAVILRQSIQRCAKHFPMRFFMFLPPVANYSFKRTAVTPRGAIMRYAAAAA